MATVKRRKKFDGTSAAAVVAGGLGAAGIAAGLGWLRVPPAIVGTALAAVGVTGAALLDGRARIALGSATGTGALVLLSSAVGKMQANQEEKARKERGDDGERVARMDGKPSKKKGRDDLTGNVRALFEKARADLALDDEEREGSRDYRAA